MANIQDCSLDVRSAELLRSGGSALFHRDLPRRQTAHHVSHERGLGRDLPLRRQWDLRAELDLPALHSSFPRQALHHDSVQFRRGPLSPPHRALHCPRHSEQVKPSAAGSGSDGRFICELCSLRE